FEEYGMKLSDINANYLPYTDGFSQLGDGNIDAAFALGGYPTAAITEIATTRNIRLIVPDEDKFANLLKKYPYYSKIVIPKEVYKQDRDIPCLGVKNIFITKKAMDAKLVYDVTKALYDHLDELAAMNATTRQIDRGTLAQLPIPIHPGAKKYFDEKK
ncbi:MAG: TAXI family TRAP transporter solute-binding subunit, partial [Thermodesulfobacteriota bacterium]